MNRSYLTILILFILKISVYSQHSDCSQIDPELCYIKKTFPSPSFILEKKIESKAHINSYHIPILADIDSDCIPEIFCPDKTNINWDISNAIYIIESKTGNTIKRISTAYFYNFSSSFLIADNDKDGMPEIYLASIYPENPQNLRDRIICYNLDGTVRWISDTQFAKNSAYVSGAPGIVDFNKDGIPELYIGNDIFNALTGVKLADGGNFGVGSLQFGYVSSVAGQLDQDSSDIELAAGYTVYKVDITNPNGIAGNKMTPYSLKIDGEYRDGSTCLADINLDGILDIIVSSDLYYYPYLYAYTFSIGSPVLLAKTNISPSFGSTIGPPTIGDIDATGIPTILIISNDTMRAFHYDNTLLLQLKWNFKIDIFAQNSGITLFDFDNNGVNEIIFGGPSKLYLIDGSVSPPLILSSIGCKAGTFAFYPIVADIDNSGHTKICTTCYIDSIKAAKMTIFGPPDSLPGWAPARRVWNQYNYNVLNINDDLTVPQYIKNNATYKNGKYNNFRAQESLLDEDGKYLDKAASLYGVIKCVNYDFEKDQYTVTFDLINSAKSSKEAESSLPVSFYNGNPETSGTLIGTFITSAILNAGDTLKDITFTFSASDLKHLFMVVNSTKNTTGTFQDTDFKIDECDYTDNFFSTLELPKFDTLSVTICEGDTYDFYGTNLSVPGVYYHKLKNQTGCDSLIQVLNLEVSDTLLVEIDKTACDEFQWHGFNLTESATYVHISTNSNGCDSVEVLNLTIHHSSITQLSQTSCDSLAWHGKTYYDTGIYQYKTQTIAGCDSTIILNLKINKSDNTALSQSACDSYTWNGNTYTQSGTYTYQTINSEGCDSIVSLQLIITDHIERSDTINICEGDSIEIFGNWVSEEGEITETFTSAAGCDSIMTYKIMIDELPEGGIAAKICEGDSIFLYQHWYSQAGSYTVKKANTAGCDSLMNINITMLPVKTSRDTISVCRGDTLMPEGMIIAKDVDIQRLLTSAESCDSIVNIHVSMLEPALTQREIKLCPGDSILIGGNWIKTDAMIEEHFTATNSCDSTSISKISLIPEPEDPEYEIDCDKREVNVMIDASEDWQILWDNGSVNSETTYKDTKEARVVLSSIPGCSRSFTMSLPQIPDLSLIKLPSDTSVARNIQVNLSLDLDTSEWQLQWYPAGVVDCPTCSSVIITATESTDMILQLTHESGCIYEVNFRIELEEGEIYVPNIFTPDGDGKNDLWKVKIPSDLYMLSCQIFDRWGEMVYRANAGEPISWDGTFRGKKTQTGVYVYVIEYKNADGESRTIKGDVTVVR